METPDGEMPRTDTSKQAANLPPSNSLVIWQHNTQLNKSVEYAFNAYKLNPSVLVLQESLSRVPPLLAWLNRNDPGRWIARLSSSSGTGIVYDSARLTQVGTPIWFGAGPDKSQFVPAAARASSCMPSRTRSYPAVFLRDSRNAAVQYTKWIVVAGLHPLPSDCGQAAAEALEAVWKTYAPWTDGTLSAGTRADAFYLSGDLNQLSSAYETYRKNNNRVDQVAASYAGAPPGTYFGTGGMVGQQVDHVFGKIFNAAGSWTTSSVVLHRWEGNKTWEAGSPYWADDHRPLRTTITWAGDAVAGRISTTGGSTWADEDYEIVGAQPAPMSETPAPPPSDPQLTDYRVFNASFYSAMYPDLQAAFGGDAGALENHWRTYGINEGRIASPEFDPVYYRDANPDLGLGAYGTAAFYQGLKHYVNYGVVEGRQASLTFSSAFYKTYHSDLSAMSYAGLTDHFHNYGIYEGRRGSRDFDSKFYLWSNADARNAVGATNYLGAMHHWLSVGRYQGKDGAFTIEKFLPVLMVYE